MAALLQVSLPVASGTATGAAGPPVHSAVIGGGHAMRGMVVSTTVTLVVQLAVLPEPSVAEKVSAVVPSGYEALPEGPASAGLPQLSLPVAPGTVTAAEAFPVHSAADAEGHAIAG